MSNYHLDNSIAGTQANMTATYQSVLETLAQTTGIKRTRVWGFNVGPAGIPSSSDCDLGADIMRATASGTATSATANPLDPNEGAATSASKVNHTVEGTVTALSQLWYVGMNQRATFAWQTNDVSQMLTGPATNAAGLVMRARSVNGYTGKVGAGWYFRE